MVESLFESSYAVVAAELERRLSAQRAGRVQLLTGPRQVGKTHLLLALAERFAGRSVYVAADTPAAGLAGWWEAQWAAAERLAASRSPAILLLDEIQYLPDWSRRLKAEVDRLASERRPLAVVASGSSSLKLGLGARETMAGRFELHRLVHWPAAELARAFGWSPKRAIEFAARFGGYPGAVEYAEEPERLRAYLRDAILEPALGRDLAALTAVRKPALVRQLFALAAGHPAEIVSLLKLRGRFADSVALDTVAHYLEVLRGAFLVAPLEKFSDRAHRRRAAPPKLITLNSGLLSALSEPPSLEPTIADPRRGRWIENACAAFAWNAGQEVTYWREEPLEVDFLTRGSWGQWAIEVKTGAVATHDLAGLLEFCRRHRTFRPLLIHESPAPKALLSATGIPGILWRDYLWSGPPQS